MASKKSDIGDSLFRIAQPERETRVLLVEDERIVATDIQRWLNRSGYSIVGTAESGDDALRLAGELLPDLVLMDIMLKGTADGIVTAEKIREIYDIPIIFLSAHTDDGIVQRAKAAQPYGYILKPYHMNEIVIAIKLAVHRHAMEKKFKADSRWITTMLASIGDAILATDQHGRINFMNTAAQKLMNWREENVMGEKIEDLLLLRHTEDDKPYPNPVSTLIKNPDDNITIGDAILHKPNGEILPVDCTAAAILDKTGSMEGVVLVLRDATDRIQAERWMRYLAFHDILTGLPNRTWLYNQLKSIIVPSGVDDARRIGIMFLDLDDFKYINDQFGHEIGDDLLCQVADRLKKTVRASDIVGRLAGDEFIVIMDRILSAHDVEKVACNIVLEFQKPFLIGGSERDITMSIGISIYPDDSENFEKLIKYADSAMYRAKQFGKNSYKFFSDPYELADRRPS
jgi:diguanylate cyclase (GGDEF)-like protein/PAS domain S-box-containing protein